MNVKILDLNGQSCAAWFSHNEHTVGIDASLDRVAYERLVVDDFLSADRQNVEVIDCHGDVELLDVDDVEVDLEDLSHELGVELDGECHEDAIVKCGGGVERAGVAESVAGVAVVDWSIQCDHLVVVHGIDNVDLFACMCNWVCCDGDVLWSTSKDWAGLGCWV